MLNAIENLRKTGAGKKKMCFESITIESFSRKSFDSWVRTVEVKPISEWAKKLVEGEEKEMVQGDNPQ